MRRIVAAYDEHSQRLAPELRPRNAREHDAVLDVEVIGIEALAGDGPTAVEVEELCALALSSAGIDDGHVAIEFVDEERIRELNREYRRIDAPTDVLSFGVDEDGPAAGRASSATSSSAPTTPTTCARRSCTARCT